MPIEPDTVRPGTVSPRTVEERTAQRRCVFLGHGGNAVPFFLNWRFLRKSFLRRFKGPYRGENFLTALPPLLKFISLLYSLPGAFVSASEIVPYPLP